jgi:hypothetical protein
LPGSKFEDAGQLPFGSVTPSPSYISLGAAAHRCDYQRKTFYNWAEAGILGPEQGVFKVRGRYRVDFSILSTWLGRGESHHVCES